MDRFSTAPHPQHAQRSSQRRNRARYALVSCILTTLVALPGVASFQSSAVADAPLETPGAASITLSRSQGRIGQAVLNDSETDRTTVVPDNSYFGVIKGMESYNSADSNESSVPYRTGYSQKWLDASVAQNDYWSYITRGIAWEYHLASVYQYPYYGDYTPYAISASTTSALGYKPNNPGTVSLNDTFLIGTVRHNNFPISSKIHWVHSSFDIRLGDLLRSTRNRQRHRHDCGCSHGWSL